MQFNVVTGAPCAGKSTYIAEHKSPGDAVLDFDSIAVAFGAEKSHECSPIVTLAAKHARKAALDALIAHRYDGMEGDVWVAHALPSEKDRRFWCSLGAVFHDLDTPKDVCLDRADADGRPDRTFTGIETYFEKKGTGQGLTLGEMNR